MKKNLPIILFFILTVLLSGCSKTDSSSSFNSTYNNSYTSVNSEIPKSESVSEENSITLNTSELQGDIQNIYYSDSNEILILADKLYLYDIITGQVLSETEKIDFEEPNYFAVDKGCVVIGTQYDDSDNGFTTSENPTMSCVIYDEYLNIKHEIIIDDLLDENEFILNPQQVTVSNDGSKIVFSSDFGLFIYDINTSTKSKLIDLLDDNEFSRYSLTSVDKVSFINDGNTIAFKSLSNDIPAIEGKESYDTYGTINIDGSGLSVNEGIDFKVKDYFAYSSKLILFDNSENPSGNVMVYDIDSNTTKTINLSTKKEGISVFGSDSGKYFATSVINEDSITIRIYETSTGYLVKEQTITEKSEYIYREPEVKIIDELNICIVLLANRQIDISTKVLVYDLN